MVGENWVVFLVICLPVIAVILGLIVYAKNNNRLPNLLGVETWLSKYIVPILVFAILAYTGALFNTPFINVFVAIEFIALVAVASVSTFNYVQTAKQLKQAVGGDTSNYYLYLFGFLNISAFFVALAVLQSSEFHILAIVFIYAFFSLANIRQMKLSVVVSSSASAAVNKKRRVFSIFSANWLGQENGPSALGFTVVLLLILISPRAHSFFDSIIPFLHSLISEETHKKSPSAYYEEIKAFAAGAATFHLTLSVLKYTAIIQREDVTEVALSKATWDQQGKIAIREISIRSRNSWKKRIIIALISSIILASAIAILDKYKV